MLIAFRKIPWFELELEIGVPQNRAHTGNITVGYISRSGRRLIAIKESDEMTGRVWTWCRCKYSTSWWT